MKRLLLASLTVAMLLGGWRLARGLFADDEAAVRAAIEDMRRAAEARDVGRFSGHISSGYRDDSNHNAMIIKNMVGRVLGSLESVRVRVEDLEVIVTGDTAYATMSVTTEAIKRGAIIHPFGSDQSPERPRVTFQKEGDDWKVIKVDNVQGGY